MDNEHRTFFIGPHFENSKLTQQMWNSVLDYYSKHRLDVFQNDPKWPLCEDNLQSIEILNSAMEELQTMLQKEVPTFTKRYIGHMLSDFSLPALLGHISVLLHNPNNASKEVAKIGSFLEIEAINLLCKMVGYEVKQSRGHFTSCGTLANFEAVWRARYRMDHFLSMALCLAKKSLLEKNLFEYMHMGWDEFYRIQNHYQISIEELMKYSATVKGPAEIARICSQLNLNYPLPALLVPSNCHYSWPKAMNLFGLGTEAVIKVKTDKNGHVSVTALRDEINKCKKQNRPILMITSVAGTTEFGGIDPIHDVESMLEEFKPLQFWHHVDAAYGGFFCSLLDRPKESMLRLEVINALQALRKVDSITIDPHKLGYVPYACGAILTKNPDNYIVSRIDAPYLIRDKYVDHPGWSTTIEGSRSATGAGAVWLSSQCLPFNSNGLGTILKKGLRTKIMLEKILTENLEEIYFTPTADTNILCFCLAKKGQSLSEVNKRSQKIFEFFSEGPDFAVSKTILTKVSYEKLILQMISNWEGVDDDENLYVIRLVLMSPYADDDGQTKDLYLNFAEFLKDL
ncbi:MAG: decarboxylase [Halobacteriovoraceae bacterium]|nr:decarboxylase [Halobacteriovoraceae bacterium]